MQGERQRKRREHGLWRPKGMAGRALSVVLALAMVLVMVLEVLPPMEARAAQDNEPEHSLGTVVHVSSMDDLI